MQFSSLTVFTPPPLTTSLPFTVTLFNVTSPSPTPSDNIKSPSTTLLFKATSGVLITTSLPLFEETAPFSVTIVSMELLSIDTTSALEIGAEGLKAPLSDPLI